jgi:uncharacterized protein YnzC (UPF0291/DUF896 family)
MIMRLAKRRAFYFEALFFKNNAIKPRKNDITPQKIKQIRYSLL